ncbi:UNVERIFIED_CONTAM: hypothetical protein GTU68_036604 [Idotea baltica]|nr:hypothetical protein [Idotea baltica]
MLELDVILLPFSQKIYPTLSSESQSIYWELLGCEDQDLFSWFMRRNQPSSTQLMTMVDMVLNNVKPA